MKTYAIINGKLNEIDEVKTISFPNGDTKMTTVSIQTDTSLVPVQVWGDKKIEFCKSNIEKSGDFICTIVGNQSIYTNHEGDERKINQAILRLSLFQIDHDAF